MQESVNQWSSRNVVVGAVIVAALPIVAVEMFSALRFVSGPSSYLLFHNVAEFFSIMVSLSMFSIGWYTYEQSTDRHALFLSVAFLGIGIMDFMHTFSNVAMPPFVTLNSSNKSTQFWIAARLYQGAVFLVSAYVYPEKPDRWLSKSVLMTSTLLVSFLVFIGITFFPAYMPATFVPGVGPTPLKRISEYLVIGLFCAAAVAYWRRMKITGDRLLIYYLVALVICVLSEFPFAVYTRVFDTYNILGHIYKVAAFSLVYYGIYRASVKAPYLRLAEVSEKLRGEIVERQLTEESLRQARNDLEARVEERTADLTRSNTRLRKEIGDRQNAEEALRSSEERYRSLFENMTQGFALHEILTDAEGQPVDYRFLEVNPAFEKLTCLKRTDLLGHCVTEALPGVEDYWIEKYGRVALTGEPTHFENFSAALGKWYDVVAYQAGPRQFAVVFSDFTERKRVEEMVRQSEERFRAIASSTPDHVLVQDYNLRYTMVVNPQLGLTEQDMFGKTDFDILVKEDAEKLTSIKRKVLETGKPVYVETPAISYGGKQEFFEGSYVPKFDGDGRCDGLIGYFRNVTERKQTEEALRESREQLGADLDAMTRLQKIGTLFASEVSLQPVLTEIVDAAIAISSADFGNIQILDPEASCLQIVAQRGFPEWWLDFWNGVAAGRGTCGTALQRGERVIVEDVEQSPIFIDTPALEIQLKAGVRAIQSTPLVSRSGRLLGMFSTHYKKPHRPDDRCLRLLDLLARQAADIIERARNEEELRVSHDKLEVRVKERTAELEKANAGLRRSNQRLEVLNKELQDFAFVASHDLQEPLRKVQAFGSMLDEKCSVSLDEAARDYISRIQSAAARMKDLLTSLLAYSRVATKVEPIKETDLRKSVEEALSNLEITIREKKARVEVGNLPTLKADRVQMIQLFQNLIGNALKFHSANAAPHVRIYSQEAVDKEGAYEIRVEDNGIGFEEKYLDKIFLPFQRLHGRSSGYEGVGMGLAICKKIVDRHDGEITARSELGKGSTFIVTLPSGGGER